MLQPSENLFYMKDVPEFDGWGHPFEFYKNDNLLANTVMLIRSPGRDGVFTEANGSTMYTVEPFEFSNYDEDIVWADGYFIRWPGATN